MDAQTKAPIENATVTTNTGEQTFTDRDGAFNMEVPSDFQFLLIYSLGYKADTVNKITVGFTPLNILLQQTGTRLKEVVVTGYGSNRPILETAGSIATVNQDMLERFDQSSLVRAMSTVPGVRMEERAPASYRISIRGSSLRAPYGVRNVKLYLDGIPLTEANGTTALNLLDASNIGNIEILKGPAGSVYGAGTGGTILLEPRRPAPGENSLQLGTTVGSFGLQKYTATAGVGTEKTSILVQYAHQQYEGYREQSAIDRDVLLLATEFYPSEKRTIGANVVYSNLYYELPGGLTREQYDLNPRQARGGQFGSVVQNASMNVEGVNVSLKQDYQFHSSFRNTTAAYGLFKFRDHPFNTDYERNANQEFGARTSFVYNTNFIGVSTALTAGGEFQKGFEASRTYDNNKGEPGKLRSDDEVVAKTGFLFVQGEFELPASIIATVALSLNDAQYNFTRLKQAAAGEPYQFEKGFAAVLSPRFALLKKVTDEVSLHGSISSGFSPPTEEEILTSDGSLNQELEAEKGTNYELGARGFLLNNRFVFDAAAFYFRLDETIVSRQDVSSVAVFRNVGSTSQKGVEVDLKYTLVDAPASMINQWKLWGAYTYSHFRFNNYQQGEKDYSGNELTGVAPHTATLGTDLASKAGLYLNLTTTYSDKIPLNDENTVYADSYLVAGARIGLKRALFRYLTLDVFAGADNLTDEKYSLGNDLNAFGARYFQPAPARNFFGGINLKYVL